MTRIEQINEYIKCKNDFLYFCMNYVYIEIPGGDQLFKPYKKQKELIDAIIKYHFISVLKSRQVGISTIIKALAAWLVVFNDNVVIGIISKDGKEATDFARDIRGMVEKVPKWMGVKFDKYTEQSFILNNGAKVFAATVNPNDPQKTLKGKAVTFLIIDEAAFIRHLDEAWTNLVPTLSTAQKHARIKGIPYGTVILSTPNRSTGVGAFFFKNWSNAVSASENDDQSIGSIFKPFKVYWREIEELASDPYWYENMKRLFDYDQKKLDQELELKFVATKGSFFDESVCSELQDPKPEPIQRFRLFNGEFWKFKEPEEGRFYITGVDTGSSHGSDNSTCVTIDFETMEEVCEFQGKLLVTDFEKVVSYIGLQYPGVVVVEDNSYGNQIVEHASIGSLSSMFYKPREGNRFLPGINTNAKTRPLMIDALYTSVSQFPTIIKSSRLSLELVSLITKPSGKVEADDGCKDDLVLALSFALYVRKYDPPMVFEYASKNQSLNNFKEIVSLNDDHNLFARDEDQDLRNINAKVIKKIKDDDDFSKSFIDVISLSRD